ncbi:hypothetical protein SAMN04488038_11588 [Solimonas aquatica]|uniref:Probable inorganic carbon transporter subunit DabA n=1 Tax=Solimonas aquatica TaxID=489703 RepID=A0A1H9LB05_9GAMM|nr:DUF2309 domain-containing protein [Solimonas aquatica]SER08377.1 hypothetical protein SAMN04488038_11588 [Solimonas aquatica]
MHTSEPVRPEPILAHDAPDAAFDAQVEAACVRACARIAPSWPLDRAIAVNPHWGRIAGSVREVAARMAVLADIQVLPPREYLAQAWGEGRVCAEDLQQALAQLPAAQQAGLSVPDCIAALSRPRSLPRLPLLIDVLDDDAQRHTRLSWRQAITHQVSQTCAAYFDEVQADWRPARGQGLYAFWRQTLGLDHGIGVLMGLPELGRHIRALPASREQAERWVLRRLGLRPEVWADYLEAVLLTVNGWASWCAYRAWQARLAGGSDGHLRDLLAIRLAWGAILLECKDAAAAQRAFGALQAQWRQAPALLQQAESLLQVDEVWQLALELGYQRQLRQRLQAAALAQAPATVAAPMIEVQAAFCIDVRSEPLRRALEAVWPAIQTIGFAGFFGLPIAYTPLGTAARRPQLPGFFAPAMEVGDQIESTDAKSDAQLHEQAQVARARHFARSEQWRAGNRWPSAAFSYVEAAGVGYLGKLRHWLWPGAKARHSDDLAGLPSAYQGLCRPTLLGLDADARLQLARRVLHAMGLEQNLAPLVLLVGHGSQSANNAQAAALDCGACCGQSGEVNARALARLLNEPALREGLRAQGLHIPDDTAFVACLHNTTTDEIEGFDLDLLPPAALARWQRLQPVLAQACDQLRRERAPRLGLDPAQAADKLLLQLRRRANDGAQTRPEWGLAGNAAFIIAPRQRSLGARLDGRCFLHDYDSARDADGGVLELLMTAPMLVTHWINWQYHASSCDPRRLGSGNKLLHNVVGGALGVFEGNGGDLRIGLSWQSVHDGERLVHEPLRLTVLIDAPRAAIGAVIARHELLQQLLDNGWLHLWRFEGEDFERYAPAGWVAAL